MKFNKLKKIIILSLMLTIIIIFILGILKNFSIIKRFTDTNSIDNIINSDTTGNEFLNQISNISTEELAKDSEKDKSYI